MHSGARKNFGEIREGFNRELDASSSLIFGDHHMSVRELIDIVVCGGLAHPKKADIFEDWERSGIMGMVLGRVLCRHARFVQTLKKLRTLSDQVLALAGPAPKRA